MLWPAEGIFLGEPADAPEGPFTTVQGGLTVPKFGKATFTVVEAHRAAYRWRE